MVILRIHTLVYTLLLADAAAAGDHTNDWIASQKTEGSLQGGIRFYHARLFAYYMRTIRSCPSSDSLIHKHRFIQQAIVELYAKGIKDQFRLGKKLYCCLFGTKDRFNILVKKCETCMHHSWKLF